MKGFHKPKLEQSAADQRRNANGKTKSNRMTRRAQGVGLRRNEEPKTCRSWLGASDNFNHQAPNYGP